MPRYEISDDEIKYRLNARALDVARNLIPDSHAHFDQHQGHYKPRNPARADNNPGSFVVFTRGEKIGWHDFASGDGGDMISLIGLALGFDASSREGYPRALEWAARYLGIAAGEAQGGRVRNDAPPNPEKADQVYGTGAGSSGSLSPQKLMGQWLSGAVKALPDRSDLLGTAFDRYLRGRDIDLAWLLKQATYKFPLGALRFHPNGRYYRGGLDDWTPHPVLCTAMTTDKITALHRTYLTDAGGKADVPSPKKIRGNPKGASVRLWRGKSGLRAAIAAKKDVRDTMMVMEGIEDGLIAAQVWPDNRICAATTIGNFINLTWPDCAHHIVLIGDNDHSAQAIEAWRQTIAHYAGLAQGRKLTPLKPPAGIKDLNDWFQSLNDGGGAQ